MRGRPVRSENCIDTVSLSPPALFAIVHGFIIISTEALIVGLAVWLVVTVGANARAVFGVILDVSKLSVPDPVIAVPLRVTFDKLWASKVVLTLIVTSAILWLKGSITFGESPFVIVEDAHIMSQLRSVVCAD